VLVVVQPERDARRLVRLFREVSERSPRLSLLHLDRMNMPFLPVRALPVSLHRLILSRPLLTKQWEDSFVAGRATFLPHLVELELYSSSTLDATARH